MFYIVFHSGFLSTCETKLTITFLKQNMQFEWGKNYFRVQEFFFFQMIISNLMLKNNNNNTILRTLNPFIDEYGVTLPISSKNGV